MSFGDGTCYIDTGEPALPRATPKREVQPLVYLSFPTDTFGWKDAPPGSLLSKLLAVARFRA